MTWTDPTAPTGAAPLCLCPAGAHGSPTAAAPQPCPVAALHTHRASGGRLVGELATKATDEARLSGNRNGKDVRATVLKKRGTICSPRSCELIRRALTERGPRNRDVTVLWTRCRVDVEEGQTEQSLRPVRTCMGTGLHCGANHSQCPPACVMWGEETGSRGPGFPLGGSGPLSWPEALNSGQKSANTQGAAPRSRHKAQPQPG